VDRLGQEALRRYRQHWFFDRGRRPVLSFQHPMTAPKKFNSKPSSQLTVRRTYPASEIGIGTRVRMVFTDVAPGLALPQWTIDESAAGGTPWRYRG
jgi:hypothetical protein